MARPLPPNKKCGDIVADEQGVRAQLERALKQLADEHSPLFSRDVNERSITHWLGAILAPLFPDWDVDCEYNRKGVDPKKLTLTPQQVSSDDIEARTVYPDVIVHCRGKTDNLLVLEAKKAGPTADYSRDMEKLRAFVAPIVRGGLEYRFGALVVFRTESTPPRAEVAEWIRGNQMRYPS